MGRRSSPNQWPFYRSVFSWFVPWALVAAIVGIGVWIAVDALSGGASNPEPPAALAGGTPTSSPSRTAMKVRKTPTPSRTKSHAPSPKPHQSPKPQKSPKAPLITRGITVQVLNATSDASIGQQMADRLARAGFHIVAVAGASRPYPRTTVFWANPSAQPAAKALAAHFAWVAAPKPSNLSAEVAIHVVVGADEL